MSRLLRRASRRYLLRHPWQMLLSIVGVALGVAVVLSIDMANDSSRRAFEMSMRSVAGEATHRIVGSPAGFPDSVYHHLRVDLGIRPSAPIVEADIALPDFPGRIVRLLGIDPFAEPPFRSYLQNQGDGLSLLTPFLTQPNAVYLSTDLARELTLTPGDSLRVRIGSAVRSVHLIGVIEPADDFSRRALQNLILTDIASAQELLGVRDRLSRIDLIVADDDAGRQTLARIEAALPSGLEILTTGSRTNTLQQMTRAFHLNLSALSLLALIVGMFLIYNTMTFSVVQRRQLIGMQRAIGVTRQEIFTVILTEATLIGIVGTVLGLGLGVVLAQGLVKLITRTINDLYFVLTVRDFTFSGVSLLKSVALGLGATMLATLAPAYEATTAPPRLAMTQSQLESRLHRLLPRLTAIGVLLLMGGTLLLWLSGRNLLLSYSGLFAFIIGCAVLTPLVTVTLMKLFRPLMTWLVGILGSMAARGVTAALSRTGVAIAALMIAIATTVGIGIMVDSFRDTVARWLDQTLRADIYVSPPSLMARRSDTTIEPEAINRIRQAPGVARVLTYRNVSIESDNGLQELVAIDIDRHHFGAYQFRQGEPAAVWQAFQAGAVLVSEPYSYRHQVSVGDTVRLRTARGERGFTVAGVYVDYGSDQGVIMMPRVVYNQYWNDPAVSALGVYTAADVAPEAVVARLRADLGADFELLIRSNRTLRETSLAIFDQTFAITSVLRLLAIVVAFIGVLSAFMALQLERARELAVLRANGLTPRQVWGLVTTQTGLMGVVAGLLSVPVGIALATIMIFVINKRSFGWSLQMQVSSDILGQALLLAIIAALLAGLYPAYKMARTSPAGALRAE